MSQRNLFNTLKGRFLELGIQFTMIKFDNERIDGKFFGKSGEIEVPLYQVVDVRYVKGYKRGKSAFDSLKFNTRICPTIRQVQFLGNCFNQRLH